MICRLQRRILVDGRVERFLHFIRRIGKKSKDGAEIHTGRVDALKRFKNDASEVKNGFECGISLVGYHDIRANDIMEAFVTERVAAEAFV